MSQQGIKGLKSASRTEQGLAQWYVLATGLTISYLFSEWHAVQCTRDSCWSDSKAHHTPFLQWEICLILALSIKKDVQGCFLQIARQLPNSCPLLCFCVLKRHRFHIAQWEVTALFMLVAQMCSRPSALTPIAPLFSLWVHMSLWWQLM
jgi:hypothetical protein